MPAIAAGFRKSSVFRCSLPGLFSRENRLKSACSMIRPLARANSGGRIRPLPAPSGAITPCVPAFGAVSAFLVAILRAGLVGRLFGLHARTRCWSSEDAISGRGVGARLHDSPSLVLPGIEPDAVAAGYCQVWVLEDRPVARAAGTG